MDFLNKGMSFLNKKNHGDSDSGSGDSSFSNPIAIFQQLDQNGDGKITEEDFVQAIQKIGLGSVGDTAVRHAFRQLDKNKNGKLDMSEAWSAFETVKHLFEKAKASGGQA